MSNKTVFYTYKGNTYKFIRECKMKVGNEWKDAVHYCDHSDDFIREKEDFCSKFEPVTDTRIIAQDFIYYGFFTLKYFKVPKEELGDYEYARYVLSTFDVPASLYLDVKQHIHSNKLFADYKGEKYRVVGLSRLGDVWLTNNFESTQYTKRVSITNLSHFSKD
nr:MAG TPA: hypothetical protein [Caudoviricetes sp.]